MPDLPTTRVVAKSTFYHVRIGLFGPITIECATGAQKRWVTLFACLLIRAIHLEATTDLPAQSFLHFFRGFVTWRGKPKIIISDNATRLKLTAKVLQEIFKELATQGIHWKFITQKASWKGGVYERLIELTKMTLRKAIGKQLLNKTDFVTLLHEVETVINKRPVTYKDSD